MTCRRFEDEVELFDVKCCLCEESKQLEIIDCRSGAAVAGHLGRKQAKGRSQVYTGEESVHPNPGGGLGLASMGRLNALMGHTTEHRVHSGSGIPWSGMIPLVMCGYPVDRNPSSSSVSSAPCSQSVSKARESVTREQSE